MAYLYQHENPHAPERSNGKQFWGYPGRSASISLIVIHTTESALDALGVDSGAENVARFQAGTDRPSSYHWLGDRDSGITMLPDRATAFGVRGYNSRALSAALAMRAADWADAGKAKAAEPALRRLAGLVALWCKAYGIPVKLITKAQADGGVKGITGHGKLDPERRSDPGAHFPWDRFLALVRTAMGVSPAPAPTTSPHPAFPLPAGHWFGPPSPDDRNHSGFYSSTDRARLSTWQRRMQQRGWKINTDGRFTEQTRVVSNAFAKQVGLPQNSSIAAPKWKAAWTAPVT